MVEETQTKQPTAAEMKAENDAMEAEIVRKQKLAEMQRLAGKAVIAQPAEAVKPETNKEYRKRIEQELKAGKFND